MFCNKCGARLPASSGFCGSCGAAVGSGDVKGQGAFSQWWASTSVLIKRDPVALIVGAGALMVFVGVFLPWEDRGRFADVLGLQMTAGPVVFVLAVLSILALMLARGGTPGAWSVVILVLSAVQLVLIFQTLVCLEDNHADSGAGLYVAMAGAFTAAAAGVLEMKRILKE